MMKFGETNATITGAQGGEDLQMEPFLAGFMEPMLNGGPMQARYDASAQFMVDENDQPIYDYKAISTPCDSFCTSTGQWSTCGYFTDLGSCSTAGDTGTCSSFRDCVTDGDDDCPSGGGGC